MRALYILYGTRTFSEHLSYFAILQENPLLASERNYIKGLVESNGHGDDGYICEVLGQGLTDTNHFQYLDHLIPFIYK